MHRILGLLFAIVFATVAIYQRTKSNFGDVAFGLLLGFAFVGSAMIAFFARIRKIKFASSALEFAEQRINQAADKAIARIETEVKKHTERISSLTHEAAKQAERIEELASGEPRHTIIKGDSCIVTVFTEKGGKKYVYETDQDGNRKKRYYECEESDLFI